MKMGLTERHWFEDEEPELTENQLEDILWENKKIFERGYQKGFSDGQSVLFQGQEPVEPKELKTYLRGIYICGFCGHAAVGSNDYRANFCPQCGKAVKWDG